MLLDCLFHYISRVIVTVAVVSIAVIGLVLVVLSPC